MQMLRKCMYNWVGLWQHMNPVPDTTIEKSYLKGLCYKMNIFFEGL